MTTNISSVANFRFLARLFSLDSNLLSGLYLHSGTRISFNLASVSGGGMMIIFPSSAFIHDLVVISQNSASRGGGIHVQYSLVSCYCFCNCCNTIFLTVGISKRV